ncbi:MAG: hypothetical protein ACI3Z0_00690 [Candidatus Cryptobacteroides sp.]
MRHKALSVIVVLALVSCGQVMDLTPPEKGDVTFDGMQVSLFETGTFEYYLDNPEYQYTILVGRSHVENDGKAGFAVREAEGEYVSLPEANWELSSFDVEFGESETVKEIQLFFKDLTSLNAGKKYMLGLDLVSDDLKVDESRKSLTFCIYQEEGGSDNPIVITTPEQLLAVESRLKAGKTTCFKLGADIDMAGRAWTPVTTTQQKLIDFDGCGHTISNLTLDTAVNGDLGFFSFLRGRMANVTFENASVSGGDVRMGVVAGRAGEADYPAVIERVIVKGSINMSVPSGSSNHPGGICCMMQGQQSRISQCASEVNIVSDWSGAGICGDLEVGANITQCRYSGNITASSRAGGIVCLMRYASVDNCCASGTIETWHATVGAGPNGGIVGFTSPNGVNPSLIDHCWADTYNNTKNQVGGILGFVDPATIGTQITNCVAWNSWLGSTNAPRSGKVSGYFKLAIGVNCWTNPDMAYKFVATWDSTDSAKLLPDDPDYTTAVTKDRYNGKTSDVTLVETVRDKAGFDSEIWDFSGEKPRLKWELEQ